MINCNSFGRIRKKLKPTNKIILFIILVSFLIGCSNQASYIKDPQGKDIVLPNCRDYIAIYSKVGIKLDLIEKYKVAINLSKVIESSLQGLEQLYALQANNLCENAGTYITLGEGQQYLCRNERLSNSAEQLALINGALESIKDIEDAKSQSENIRLLIKDYHERFLKQLDSPCTEAPKVKLPADIFRDIEKNTREALKTQRPYISVSSPSIINEGQQTKLKFIWQNVGRTPAKDITGNLYFIDSMLFDKPILIIPLSMGNPMFPGMGISGRNFLEIPLLLPEQSNIPTMYVVLLLKYQDFDTSIEFNDSYFFKWANGQLGFMYGVDQQEKNKIQNYVDKLGLNP